MVRGGLPRTRLGSGVRRRSTVIRTARCTRSGSCSERRGPSGTIIGAGLVRIGTVMASRSAIRTTASGTTRGIHTHRRAAIGSTRRRTGAESLIPTPRPATALCASHRRHARRGSERAGLGMGRRADVASELLPRTDCVGIDLRTPNVPQPRPSLTQPAPSVASAATTDRLGVQSRDFAAAGSGERSARGAEPPVDGSDAGTGPGAVPWPRAARRRSSALRPTA